LEETGTAAADAIREEMAEFDAEQIRSEIAAVDIGNLAKDEDEAILLRYLRRRSQVQAEITHIAEQTKALLRTLENRVKALDYVYLGQVEAIARKKITGKVKSLKTPFGVVGFRSNPGGIFVEDEAKLIEEATLAPDDSPLKKMYELSPKVKRAEVTAHFKASGEIPPGCNVKDSEERFYVK
jgi:hypothetical protein